MPDEEEMEAMFNMMFAEMMGFGVKKGKGSKRGGFEIPIDMFDMMEAMMEGEMNLNDDYDDDDDDYATMEDIMGAFGMKGRNVFVYDEDEDDEEYDSDDFDEEDLLGWQEAQFGAALMNEMLSAERRHEASRRGPKMMAHAGGNSFNGGSNKTKKQKQHQQSSPSKGKSKKATGKSNGSKSSSSNTTNSSSSSSNKKKTSNGSDKFNAGRNKNQHVVEEDDDDEEEEEGGDGEDQWETDESDGDSRKKGKSQKGRKSSKRSSEDDLMTAMMQQMASELGISSAGLRMFADNGYLNPVFDEDDEDEEDYDDEYGGDELFTAEEVAKMEKKREKNRKKKAQQKQNKKLKKAAANTESPAAIPPPAKTSSSHSKASSTPASSLSTNGVQSQPVLPTATSLPSSSSSHTGRRKSETDVGVETFGAAPNSRHSVNGLSLGDKVIVQGRHRGVVAFLGEVHYAKGLYAGVIMNDPSQGKNNGIIKGMEYFHCGPKEKGLMVPIGDLRPL